MSVRILSQQEMVGLKIYEYNLKNEAIYEKKLVDIFKDRMERLTVSKSLDKLNALGIIESNWENVDNWWVRSIKICKEYVNFFKGLHEKYEGD